MPEYLEEALREEPIASYNMGLFGGNDIGFIHAFCKEAMALCDTNKAACSDGNFNLLFEQMLFASLAQRKNIPVSTVCPGIYNDNGYTAEEFCQLYDFEHKSYFHFLGGHKRNQDLTESLEEVLIARYPDYYKAVVSLFTYLQLRCTSDSIICLPLMSGDMPIMVYIDFLNKAERDWSNISWDKMAEVDTNCIKSKALARRWDEQKEDTIICINPYLKCFDVPESWGESAMQIVRKRLHASSDAPVERIAVVPTLLTRQRKEYVLYELEWQVLELLKESPMQVSDVLAELISRSKDMRMLWLNEIRILLDEGLIITTNQ